MYILGCPSFDGEISVRHKNACCTDCHERNYKIPVTPFRVDATLESRAIDWELGIQGEVCCGRFEFVRSLSREWWVRKLAEVNQWDEAKVQSLLLNGSWHATMEKRQATAAKVRAANISACVSCGKTTSRGESLCALCASDAPPAGFKVVSWDKLFGK